MAGGTITAAVWAAFERAELAGAGGRCGMWR